MDPTTANFLSEWIGNGLPDLALMSIVVFTVIAGLCLLVSIAIKIVRDFF